MSSSTEDSSTRWGRTKAKVLLAGGIGLGVGAIASVATWNDSGFLFAGSGGGSANLEGSLDGEWFTTHELSGQAAELDFVATQMEPGETVYAPFSVRLDGETAQDAKVDAGSGLNVARSDGDFIPDLSFAVFEGLSTCDAASAVESDPIGRGETLAQGNVPLKEHIDLTAGEGDAPGEPVDLCFAITAGSGIEHVWGEQAEASWRIQALSNDS